MLRRLRSADGFGLIELMIAMAVLSIGLMALLATYGVGYSTLQRASRQGTASTLVDRTLEALRGKSYAAIGAGTTTTTYSSASSPPSPDGHTYVVTATVDPATAPNTATTGVKVVTITVTDAVGHTWASERSLLDPLTG
jgi:prepilin-type N-terminal cleavage/methylation domain-containing protein